MPTIIPGLARSNRHATRSAALLLALTLAMPAAAAAGTSALFGSNISREPASEPFAEALARHEALFGPLKVVRIFYTPAQRLPKPWTSPELSHGRSVVVSFKLLPDDVNRGAHDAAMRTWFATAPRDRDVWWVYWHEPEDDMRAGRFTAAAYRQAFARLDQLADLAGNPRLHTTQVLMDWSLDPRSRRNWRDYYPGAEVIDVQAWDQYDYANQAGDCTYQSMEEHEARRPAYQVTVQEGNQYAIAEIGSQHCIDARPDWLEAIGRWARTRAVFVALFHRNEFRLDDVPSQQAWRSVVTGSLFWAPPVLTTVPADGVTQTSAILHCDVDPRELETTFWFTSWRVTPTGNRDFTEHRPVTLTGGPERRTLTLTGLVPGSRYVFRCKAQNRMVTAPVRSDKLEFVTLP
jgi:hypothetical protein